MGQRSRWPKWGWSSLGWISLMGLALVGTACERSPSNTQTSDLTAPLPQGTDPLPPPPPEGAFLAQLSPEQTAQLNSLGVDIIVPGVVPPSFRVVDLRISQGDAGVGYIVVYQSTENQCFGVEFADGGIGDPPTTENRLPIQPPLFGDESYGLNYGEFTDAELRSQFPGSNLFTDWLMGRSGAYRLMGVTLLSSFFPDLTCEDVPPETAVDLAESFTLLTSEPMGEDLGLPTNNP